MPDDHRPRPVSTKHAADALNVSTRTLHRWLTSGIVTPAGQTAGGHYRWDLDDLRRQVAQHLADRPEGDHVPEPATTPEHPPVVAAIVTSELGVLAGRRNDGKPPWTFIAGEVEPGESIADAATREVKEETGLTVIAGEREIGRRVHPKTGRTMIYLACAPAGRMDVFVGDTEELAEVRWLTLAEADERMPSMFEPVHSHLRHTLGE